MKSIKKILTASVFAIASIGAANAEKLSVAATAVPHAELLEFVKPALAKEGVDLEIKVFTDYVQPNQQVIDKAIDVNFFQHKPYLDSFNKEHKSDLVPVGNVHVEPLGAFSKKINKGETLKKGAVVAIPNDPTNGARALLLLQANGLIELKDPKNILSTTRDIVKNDGGLKFKEIEAATLPRVLADVDLAVINANYALEAGLNPVEDAVYLEGSESPYANIVAARPDNKDKPEVTALVKALQTEDVKKFINDKYKGAVVPAF